MISERTQRMDRPFLPSEVQVVVMMGGMGTRLKSETQFCPKPLVRVNDSPFFQYQFELMVKQGFSRFLFCVGYRANMIEEYFGTGEKWGVNIEYSYDGSKLLGTGGAVRKAFDRLEDNFMVIYGDSFMDIDYDEILYFYYKGIKSGKEALMTILHNRNKLDKSNVWFENKNIILYDKKHAVDEMEYIDYGISIFEKKLFENIPMDTEYDLAVLQHELSVSGKLAGCEVLNRFYEIGTPQSLNEFRNHVDKRFEKSKKAIFLDRDGVINDIVFNDETEQLDSPLKIEQIHLKDGVFEALKIIQDLGYYIFIVTNQPSAAKGKVLLETLYEINNYINKVLRQNNIFVQRIFMCPHYPEKNIYTKETFLIKKCECRKPKDGMLKQAAHLYKINKEESFMVGDSYTDIEAGKSFGIKTVLIGQLKCDMCQKLMGNKPDSIVASLLEFAMALKKGEL